MSPRQILNSWKEIARYLGRGVRTAQRYEAEYRLPVHRPASKDRSAVLAFSDELDAWLAGTPKRVNGQALRNPKYLETQRQTLAMLKVNRELAQAVHAQTQRVRATLEKLRKDRGKRSSNRPA